MLRLLPREQIHDKKWNGCVHFAPNGLPYGFTWYLDNLVEDWQGVVYGNYDAVMPIISNRKFGIEYLYQPMFTQQLGWFCMSIKYLELYQELQARYLFKYKYVDICLNDAQAMGEDGKWIKRDNQIMYLDQPLDQMRMNYSSQVQRSIKKAQSFPLYVDHNLAPEDFISFYKAELGAKDTGLKDHHYYSLIRNIYKSVHYKVGVCAAVRDAEGTIYAVGFYLNNIKRVVQVANAVNEAGRKNGAMHFLVDQMLERFFNQVKIFDFGGSSIANIQQFNLNFGAENRPYYRWINNQLPWPIRHLKVV